MKLSVRFAGLCSVNELGLSWRTYRNVLEPILVCSWQRKCLSIHITYFVLSLLILSCRLLTRDETRASPSSSTLANFPSGQLMTSISSSDRWSRSEIELLLLVSPLLLRFSCYFKSACICILLDNRSWLTLTVVIILFRGLVTLCRTRW